MAKVKLIDVAKQAGVSKSTVSQYLNGRFDYMSTQTKERIEVAVKALNYVPNAIARSLKTDKTLTIGVVVRDIAGFYTSKALRGIDDYCKQRGYNVIIYNTDFDPETEIRSLESLARLNVDGIIITSTGDNLSLIKDYEDKGLPIVHFQIEYEGNDRNLVVSDYYEGARMATEHLLELGHQRIAFITQSFDKVVSRKARFLGYCEALNAHGITSNNELILHWDRNNGFANCPIALINSNLAPTAMFGQHLAITSDLLIALNQASLAVGKDISLIGFDDMPMAEFFKVPITVVQQDPYRVGRESAMMLLECLHNKALPTRKLSVPCSLILRQSCERL